MRAEVMTSSTMLEPNYKSLKNFFKMLSTI
jgi:hypothetical protein